MGLYIEFNNPGLILPGVVGAVCLVLTGFAFQILPFSWVGLVLILAGLGLMVAEMFVTSFGLLFARGSRVPAGRQHGLRQPEVSDLNVSFWSVLVPAVAGLGSFAGRRGDRSGAVPDARPDGRRRRDDRPVGQARRPRSGGQGLHPRRVLERRGGREIEATARSSVEVVAVEGLRAARAPSSGR